MRRPTYHVRNTPKGVFLNAGPCPHCHGDNSGTSTTPIEPGLVTVQCWRCSGTWKAQIRRAS